VSERIRHDVCHDLIWVVMLGGKSEPLSTIQETDCETGGGEKRRAPSAEKEPAPPRMLKTGGLGGR
jgi:hypothetical protein